MIFITQNVGIDDGYLMAFLMQLSFKFQSPVLHTRHLVLAPKGSFSPVVRIFISYLILCTFVLSAGADRSAGPFEARL